MAVLVAVMELYVDCMGIAHPWPGGDDDVTTTSLRVYIKISQSAEIV